MPLRWKYFKNKMERVMSNNEIAFLILALGAFSLFGGVLAWASWMESRAKRHAE